MRQRVRTRLALSTALAIVAVMSGATDALAYWTGSGTGLGSAFVTTLLTPSLTVTPSTGAAELRWTAVTPPEGSSSEVTYFVKRNGGAPTANCPSEAAPAKVTTCLDGELASGTYTYTVTAVWRSWRAESEPQTVSVSSNAVTHFTLEAAKTTVGAGESDALTIVAKNASNVTATGFSGTHALTFEGAGAGPNGSQPTVTSETGAAKHFGEATPIRFVEGKATVSGATNGAMTLYKIEEAHIKVSEGTINNGAGLAVKVTAGEARSFRLSQPTPAEPEAGQALSTTITALDAGGNTAVSYGGAGGQAKTIAWSGPESSPSGKAPEYPASATTVTFKEGVGTATAIKLYRSGATTLTAKEGTKEGSVSLTVKAGAYRSLGVTPVPAEPQAGVAFEVKLAAWDEWHNPIASYTRTGKLRYEGAAASPSGKAPEYSANTTPTFANGEATLTGFRFYKAASTTLKVTEEGTGHTGTGTFTVKAGAAKTFTLAAASTEVEVGKADDLTISAFDEWGNAATSYGGAGGEAKSLTFEGAGAGPNGSQPTVTSETGAAKHFGEATPIRFVEGKATVSGATNGAMTLYKIEEAHIKVSAGTVNNGAGLAVKVKVGEASSFSVSAPTPAEPRAGQAIKVTITALDAGGNVATGYTGRKTISYSGPEPSEDETEPEYPASATSVTFKEGVGTATGIKLYNAGSTTLTAEAGSIQGSVTFNVAAARRASAFELVFAPSEVIAGEPTSLTIKAVDAYGNVAATYAGNHNLTFEGAQPSPSGEEPFVVDRTGAARNFGERTSIDFVAGEATVTGGANGLMTLYNAEEAHIRVVSGRINNGAEGQPIKVAAGQAVRYSLSQPTPAAPEAGAALDVTISAVDPYGNVSAAYGGPSGEVKHISYSGPLSAPNGQEPLYPTSATSLLFVNGVATATGIRLYDAGQTTLTARETGHIVAGARAVFGAALAPVPFAGPTGLEGSVTFSVAPGPFKAFGVTPIPAEPQAGAAFEAKVSAWDEWGNQLTTYTRRGRLRYEGAEASPSGKAPEYSANTTPTFANGQATLTGFHFYKAASTTLKVTEEGTGHSGSGTFTVLPGEASSFRLSAPTPAEPEAGQSLSTTITALDAYANTATSYGGAGGQAKTIAWSGPESSPSGKAPEYPASATTVTFKEGVGTATAIKLYRAGATTLTAKEGTKQGSSSFTVKAGAYRSLGVTPIPAEPQAGATFEVKLAAWDEWHNAIASYTRTGKLRYEGAEASPSGKAPEYSANTTPTFANGEATLTGFRFYKAASTTLKVAEEGTGRAGQATFTVKPGEASSFRLSAPTPAEPEAGQSLSTTITALDAYANTATSYGGAGGQAKTIAWSGPESSPSGKAPEYPASATTVTFKEGVGTATAIKLYRAGATTLTAKEGTKEGSSSFTVKAGAFKSLGVTPVTTEPQAGVAFEVKLAAWDEWHNTIASYARTGKLRYEGAEASPSGKAPEYSTSTEPAFSAGQATVAGFKLYKAGSTTLKVTEEGTGHTGSGTFAVKAGTAKSLHLAAASGEVEVGKPDDLTITALDEWANTATSYGGSAGSSKSLTFEGAGQGANGDAPTVTSEAGAAKKLGEATPIKFVEGVAGVSGQSNGVLTLYKPEEAHIKVSDGTINNGTGLAIKVKAGEATTFRLSAPTPAEPQAGAAVSVTLTALDAGGDVVTSYGGAGGQAKTIAWSGPESSPSGKAPEYPASATTVTFKEGVGTATAIKLYRAGATTLTAKEGTKEGSVSFTVQPAAAKRLAWSGPTASAGTMSATCLFTCTVEGLGAESTFTSKVAVTDEWGNPQASHGAAVTVNLKATLVKGIALGGGLSAPTVTIAAGASTSGSFTLTTTRFTAIAYEYALEATATGYTGELGAKATLKG